jgi:hypothetical protein
MHSSPMQIAALVKILRLLRDLHQQNSQKNLPSTIVLSNLSIRAQTYEGFIIQMLSENAKIYNLNN